MQWLTLLSSQRWVCVLSASVPGRVSGFREAQKGIASMRSNPQRTPDINRPTLLRKK
jgi:hypothetical protein